MTKGNVTLIQADCMDVMAKYKDNYFDLAIVDPPYGINRDGGETGKNWKLYESKNWDNQPPSKEYFQELFRVSKNQIIWGGNYFTQYLPASMGWVFWDKGQKLTMSDGELAFTSFQKALRSITINRCKIGINGGNIHPTQKPLALYQWLYNNYSTKGQRILDTHLGSGSNAIAAHYFGVGEFIGVELDKDYFKDACKRFNEQTRQLKMF